MCLLKIPKGETSHQLAGSLDSTKYCGILVGTDENRITVYRLGALSEKNNRNVTITTTTATTTTTITTTTTTHPQQERERESWRDRERDSEREREREGGGREKLIVSGLDLYFCKEITF